MLQEMEIDQLIERYLLGDLPQLEREQVEARYFAEPDFLERVDVIERDLIEDYVSGALSQEKRQRVEENLLRSPYQWEKVRFAETLLHSVDEFTGAAETDAVGVSSPARISWREAILNFFRLQPRLALAASAVVLLLAGTLIVEIIRLRLRLESVQQDQITLRQRAEAQENIIAEQRNQIEQLTGQPQVPEPKITPEKENTPPAPKTHFAMFTSPLLFSGSRAGDQPPELPINRRAETVRLRLVYDGKPYPRFRAVLTDGADKIIWQNGGWTAKRLNRRQEIDVDIPARLFEERIYTLSLKAKTSSGEESVSLYTFQVTRK